MKKLLILLSILTITVISMPNVIATSNYEKEEKLENTKQELSLNDYLEFNNKYIEKIIEKNNVFVIDNQDNIYFLIKNELFLLKKIKKTPIKITEISNDIIMLKIDNKNTLYFTTNNNIYVLKSGEKTAKKINRIKVSWPNYINKIKINNKNNIYFHNKNNLYVLKQKKPIISKLKTISDSFFNCN
ncbi:hypothetical protein [Spiroplasma endosymbiont of Polydrusus formosus]|uniref:hypothetical protein n=1 Tax=Spiroplasma endosymbiont of Polydrusus formosus TaxID=3139326 RepID=UPI0035B54656